MEQLLVNLGISLIKGVVEMVRENRALSEVEKKAKLDEISAKLDAAGIRVAAAEIRDV